MCNFISLIYQILYRIRNVIDVMGRALGLWSRCDAMGSTPGCSIVTTLGKLFTNNRQCRLIRYPPKSGDALRLVSNRKSSVAMTLRYRLSSIHT